MSFPDARELVEAETPVVVDKPYAAAAKGSTRRVSSNADLTWRYDEAKYKMLSDVQTNCKTKYQSFTTTERSVTHDSNSNEPNFSFSDSSK